MNVLLLAEKDNANLGYELAQCLKSVGVSAQCVAKRVPKIYAVGAKIYRDPSELLKLVDDADIIIFMHSRHVDLGKENRNKPALVFHGGTDYRRDHVKINEKFREENITTSLIQTLDLWGLPGANKEIWLMPPVNTNKIQPVYEWRAPGKKIIAHYPAGIKTGKKGSKVFARIINKLSKDPALKNKFVYKTGSMVALEKNLKRVTVCDIYFESFKPVLDGKKLGEWGMAALEAAALGKVVLANFFSHKRYEKEYGKHTIQIANTVARLESQLRKLILMSDDRFLKLQKKTREWVVSTHSYESVGGRLVNILNDHLILEGR